jgi:hypothetical protein
MSKFLHPVVVAAAVALGAGLRAQSAVPDIPYDTAPRFALKMPDEVHLGEAAGIATNSAGHLFVYTRTGNPTAALGNSRIFAHGGSRLFEFDAHGVFVREIGQGIYGFLVAQAARVDAQDNIWVVDAAASQVIKFSPEGRVLMVMGRKAEAIAVRLPSATPPVPGPGRGGAGDQFTRPADVAWDGDGNIFVADGLGANARIAKFDRTGRFLLSWGSRGSEHGQFNAPHAVVVDARGDVYVADQGNKRIQVFDNNGVFKSQIENVGAPTALCMSRGPHQYLFSSHTGDAYGMDDAAIYKLELDGRIVGKFGRAGKLPKELGLVNALDCRSESEIFVGELANWRVQKFTLAQAPAR